MNTYYVPNIHIPLLPTYSSKPPDEIFSVFLKVRKLNNRAALTGLRLHNKAEYISILHFFKDSGK